MRIFKATDKVILNRDDGNFFSDRRPQEGRKILVSRPLRQRGRSLPMAAFYHYEVSSFLGSQLVFSSGVLSKRILRLS